MIEIRKELGIALANTFSDFVNKTFEKNNDELSDYQSKEIFSALLDVFILAIEAFTHQIQKGISRDIILESIKNNVVRELNILKANEYD